MPKGNGGARNPRSITRGARVAGRANRRGACGAKHRWQNYTIEEMWGARHTLSVRVCARCGKTEEAWRGSNDRLIETGETAEGTPRDEK